MTEADALHLVHQRVRHAMGEVPVHHRHHPSQVLHEVEILVEMMDVMREEHLKCAMKVRDFVAK